MINTENNESLIEISEKKEFIQKIYSKIENFDKEIEFHESLILAILSSIKSNRMYHFFDQLIGENFNKKFVLLEKTNSFNKNEYSSFLKEIVLKSNKMSDNSRDVFWSMIYTIIKLSNSMFNKDDVEAEQLYRMSRDDLSGFIDTYDNFCTNWITSKIKHLYSTNEISEILNLFNTEHNELIHFLVKNVVDETEMELPFQEPCLVTFFSDLFDYVDDIYIEEKEINFIELSTTIPQKGIKFDFDKLVAPGFFDIQSNGIDKYNNIDRKRFLGKYVQFVMLSLYFEKNKSDNTNNKLLQTIKSRFVSDKYLIEFLKNSVLEYSNEILLEIH